MADVYVNALTQLSTEPTSTDSVVLVNRNTNEGQIIDYNLLADKILAKLTSKTYSGLTTSAKVLINAINELDSDVSSLNSSLSGLVTTRQFSGTYAIAANSQALITMDSIGYSVPTGYTAIAYRIVGTGNPNVFIRSLNLLSSNGFVALYNSSASALSNLTITVDIAFVKTAVVSYE